jgi:hypothetical protein
MAAKTWVVCDRWIGSSAADSAINQELRSAAPEGTTVEKRRWQGGTADGVEEILVNNGRLQFSILPTRGMGLWKGSIDGVSLGWDSPVRGPIHPQFVPVFDPSGLGWLEGFDEWICRCGLLSNGAPDFDDQGRLTHPLHGRIANLPALRAEISIDGDQITVTGEVIESRFHFQKLLLSTSIVTRRNDPTLTIHDRVTNLSASPGEMQMLYHCNFGAPILGAGAELVAPAAEVVPRNDWAAEGAGHWSTFTEPTAGMPERVYLMKLRAGADKQTMALLKDARGERGVSLAWDVDQLPCFTLWKNETSLQDGYVTGLEPGTNFPNPRSFETEKGRVVKLAPGASHQMSVRVTYHDSAESIGKAEAMIAALQGNQATKLFEQPQPDWCA